MKNTILLLLVMLLTSCAPLTPAMRTAPLASDANDIVLDPSVSYNTLTVSASGTADYPITVWGNGATAKCVDLSGAYIVLQNVTVVGCNSHGILIRGNHITVANNTVSNVVTQNGTGKCIGGSVQWGSAIKVYNGASHILITKNNVSRSCGEGIDSARGIDVTITYNTVTDVFSVGIYPDNSNGVTVLGNTVICSDPNYYRNGKPANGVLIGAENYSGWGFQLANVLVENNTFYGCSGIRYYATVSGTPVGVRVVNNYFSGVPAPFVSLPSWAEVSGNVALVGPTLTPGPTRTPTASSTPAPPTATRTQTPVVSVTPSRTPSPAPTASLECHEVTSASGTKVLVCFP